MPKGYRQPESPWSRSTPRLTRVTDTGPHRCRSLHVGSTCTLSHLYPSAFYEDLSPRRCNSVLVFSAHHLEDGRDGDLIGLATPEECRGFPLTCCQDDANRRAGCRKRGALPALNAFKVHLFAFLWPNSATMRRTALKNEELVRSKRGAPALLLRSNGATACTAHQRGDVPAQAQVRTSRLPCGLCSLLASLMWRESKPLSHDSIQTALCRPGGNVWASRFMPTSRPMASLRTRRRNTDDTSTAAWTCGWFIASDSFANCAHSSVSKTFASAGPPVARRCSARMPLSVTVGEYQLVTMEKCVHAHLTYPMQLAGVPGFLKMARNLQTSTPA